MKQRKKIDPNTGHTSMTLSWQSFVEEPFNLEYYVEAFASADAMLDDQIESLLRQIYNEFKCQDLINEILLVRGKTNFQGLTIVEVLKNKTVVNEQLYQRLLHFKKARNLISHNIDREYALIAIEEYKGIKSQKELDDLVKSRAQSWIKEAKEIYDELHAISSKIYKKESQFFSSEFYHKNPRGKYERKNHPSFPGRRK